MIATHFVKLGMRRAVTNEKRIYQKYTINSKCDEEILCSEIYKSLFCHQMFKVVAFTFVL